MSGREQQYTTTGKGRKGHGLSYLNVGLLSSDLDRHSLTALPALSPSGLLISSPFNGQLLC